MNTLIGAILKLFWEKDPSMNMQGIKNPRLLLPFCSKTTGMNIHGVKPACRANHS
jgi:hypothetical protein